MKKSISFAVASIALFMCTKTFASSVEAGKKLVEENACVSCHGEGLKKPIAPNYPKLAGQHEDYVYYALKSYQVENNSLVGRSNAIMGGQAKKFTHQELKNIAAYIASLPSDFVIKK